MRSFIRVLIFFALLCGTAFGGGTFFAAQTGQIVISKAGVLDTLGRAMVTPDSMRITVSDSAGAELFDSWFEAADSTCNLNGDNIVFFDTWGDINGSNNAVGTFHISVVVASDGSGNVDVFSPDEYVVYSVTEPIETHFNEVANIDAWNPITDNDSLIIDHSTLSARPAIGDTSIGNVGAVTLSTADTPSVNVEQWRTGIPTALSSNNVRVDVFAMQAGMITSTVMATNSVGDDEWNVTEVQADVAQINNNATPAVNLGEILDGDDTGAPMALTQFTVRNSTTGDTSVIIQQSDDGIGMLVHTSGAAGNVAALKVHAANSLNGDATEFVSASGEGFDINGNFTVDGDKVAYVADSSIYQGAASGITKESVAQAVRDTLESGDMEMKLRSLTVDSGTVFAAATDGTGLRIAGGIGTTGIGLDIDSGVVIADATRAVDLVATGTNGVALRARGDGSGGLGFHVTGDGSGAKFATSATGGSGFVVDSGVVIGAHNTGVGLTVTGGAGGGDASQFTAQAGNQNALKLTAVGTGDGLLAVAGATGNGVQINGGGTSGAALYIDGVATGDGITILGAGAEQGVNIVGGATGVGMLVLGGATSGDAAQFTAQGGNNHGVKFTGDGTGNGMRILGEQAGGGTGVGLYVEGGDASGDGIQVASNSGDGVQFESLGGNGDGFKVIGQGSGEGFRMVGGATGKGMQADSGFFVVDDGVTTDMTTGGSGLDTLSTAHQLRLATLFADTTWRSMFVDRDGEAGSFADSAKLWAATGAGASGSGASVCTVRVVDTSAVPDDTLTNVDIQIFDFGRTRKAWPNTGASGLLALANLDNENLTFAPQETGYFQEAGSDSVLFPATDSNITVQVYSFSPTAPGSSDSTTLVFNLPSTDYAVRVVPQLQEEGSVDDSGNLIKNDPVFGTPASDTKIAQVTVLRSSSATPQLPYIIQIFSIHDGETLLDIEDYIAPDSTTHTVTW